MIPCSYCYRGSITLLCGLQGFLEQNSDASGITFFDKDGGTFLSIITLKIHITDGIIILKGISGDHCLSADCHCWIIKPDKDSAALVSRVSFYGAAVHSVLATVYHHASAIGSYVPGNAAVFHGAGARIYEHTSAKGRNILGNTAVLHGKCAIYYVQTSALVSIVPGNTSAAHGDRSAISCAHSSTRINCIVSANDSAVYGELSAINKHASTPGSRCVIGNAAVFHGKGAIIYVHASTAIKWVIMVRRVPANASAFHNEASVGSNIHASAHIRSVPGNASAFHNEASVGSNIHASAFVCFTSGYTALLPVTAVFDR